MCIFHNVQKGQKIQEGPQTRALKRPHVAQRGKKTKSPENYFCQELGSFFCYGKSFGPLTCFLHFPSRFDYEGLDPRAAFYLMRDLEAVITDKAFTSQKFAVGDHVYGVEKAENFEYIDPVDGSVTRNQVSCSNDRKWRIAVRADSEGMEMSRGAPVPIPVSGIGTDTWVSSSRYLKFTS